MRRKEMWSYNLEIPEEGTRQVEKDKLNSEMSFLEWRQIIRSKELTKYEVELTNISA